METTPRSFKHLMHWEANRVVGAPSPLIAHLQGGFVIGPSRPNYMPSQGSPAIARGAELPTPGTDEWCWLELAPNGRMYFAYPLAPENVSVPGRLIEGVLVVPPSANDTVTAHFNGAKLVIEIVFAPES